MGSSEEDSAGDVTSVLIEDRSESGRPLGRRRVPARAFLKKAPEISAVESNQQTQGAREVERRSTSAGPRERPVNTPVMEERGDVAGRSNTSTRKAPTAASRKFLYQANGNGDAHDSPPVPQSVGVSSSAGGETGKRHPQGVPISSNPGLFAKASSLKNRLTKSPSSNGTREAGGTFSAGLKSPSPAPSTTRARLQLSSSSPTSNPSDTKPRTSTPTRTGLKSTSSSSATSANSVPRQASPARGSAKSLSALSLNSVGNGRSRPSSPARSSGSLSTSAHRGSSIPSTPNLQPTRSGSLNASVSSDSGSSITSTSNINMYSSPSPVVPPRSLPSLLAAPSFSVGAEKTSSATPTPGRRQGLTSLVTLKDRSSTPTRSSSGTRSSRLAAPTACTTNVATRPVSLSQANAGKPVTASTSPAAAAWPSRSNAASKPVSGSSGTSPSSPTDAVSLPASPSRSTSANKAVQIQSPHTVGSVPLAPTRSSAKPVKSLVPSSTKVVAPSLLASVKHSASSQSLVKSKPAPLVPTQKSLLCESPKSLSSSRGDSNMDAPSVSGSAIAARKAVPEHQAQRLRIAGFKRNPGSPKPASVVPEGLPVSPMTLNAKKRCGWITSQSDGNHVAYHDTEWGVPIYDDKLLFELMVLQGAQAELSWPTILARRDNFRAAFADFEPAVVAKFDERKITLLRADPSICFPEAKVRGAVENAMRVLEIVEEYGSFSKFLWSFVNHKPSVSHYKLAKQVPVKTPKSEALSKELVRRGFRFVGPTTMYSVMQAAGMVNDHLVTCFKHQELMAETSAAMQQVKTRGEEAVDLWQCISMPEWRSPAVCEAIPRVELLDMYFREDKRVVGNSCEPVWAELPMIEEVREDDLEKTTEEDDIYDGLTMRAECEIPVC